MSNTPSNMEFDESDELQVIIYFDTGESIQVKKSLLIEQSLYFEAMFSGQFRESNSNDPIELKHVNYTAFMKIMNCLEYNTIVSNTIEDLFLLLETSQFLQFTKIIEQAIKYTKKNYFFTPHIARIYTFAQRLGLKELYETACVYIIYNFRKMLFYGRHTLINLSKEELLFFLTHDGLNIYNEMDVYNLIYDWLKINTNENEYEIMNTCVRFDDMSKNQLHHIIEQTKDLEFQNMVKQFVIEFTCKKPMQPIRCLPHVLCTMQNDADGYAFIYQWDWELLQFKKTVKVDPLPANSVGYHFMVKDMDVYVISGVVNLTNKWINTGWKYSFISKEWTALLNFFPSDRCFGIGCFCGNDLFLIGGRTQNNLANELVEHFIIDETNNTLKPLDQRRDSYIMGKAIGMDQFTCLNYRGQFVFIQKYPKPKWYGYHFGEHVPLLTYECNISFMNLNVTIICVTVFNNVVYLLVYNQERSISLFAYIPSDQTHRRLFVFETLYDEEITMCAFNMGTVMVFHDNTLECFFIDANKHRRHEVQLGSFKFNQCFNVPIYTT